MHILTFLLSQSYHEILSLQTFPNWAFLIEQNKYDRKGSIWKVYLDDYTFF